MDGNPTCLSNTTSITQDLVSPEMEISTLPQVAMNRNMTWERRPPADQDTDLQDQSGRSRSTRTHKRVPHVRKRFQHISAQYVNFSLVYKKILPLHKVWYLPVS